ncbi:MAG: NAD(P)-dependent oxidoreductase [Burkholderiales bacterium]|nr:NAD(P)-dependent oxidoreductase [Burkholderiales bacterium]
MSKPRIGFVGIGWMGHGIARNLVAKGHPLLRTPIEVQEKPNNVKIVPR